MEKLKINTFDSYIEIYQGIIYIIISYVALELIFMTLGLLFNRINKVDHNISNNDLSLEIYVKDHFKKYLLMLLFGLPIYSGMQTILLKLINVE